MNTEDILSPIKLFLQCETPQEWIDKAAQPENLPIILLDHLVCELKAAQTGMWLIRKYAVDKQSGQNLLNWLEPYEKFVYKKEGTLEDLASKLKFSKSIVPKSNAPIGQDLIDKMVLLIKEELHHFYQVLEIMNARNIPYENISAGRYAKGMMKKLKQQGFAVVLMHFRNCSREVNRLARAYHSGETEDLRFFINHLKSKFPKRPLFAVGFSLGGNVLAKYLGEQGTKSNLTGAAVVSAPFDLSSSCEVIRKSLGKIYQKYLLDRMKKSMQRKLPQIEQQISLTPEKLMAIDDLWQFDNMLTAPLHGFAGAEDYYQQASGLNTLNLISTNTLILHAKDDPFLCHQAVTNTPSLPTNIAFEVAPSGGHVGFISGNNPFKPVYWLEQRIPQFFKAFV